jgi:potassium-dependent mechanosensitive channel
MFVRLHRFKKRIGAKHCGWLFGIVALACLITIDPARGQQSTEPAANAAEQPAPIPLVDVATESESVAAALRDIRAYLSSSARSTETVAQTLPVLTREIESRARETRKIVVQSPSIEVLRGLEGEWRRLRRQLNGLNHDLTDRVHELEGHIAQLANLGKTWDQTFAAAKESSVPPEVGNRIDNVIREIRQAREEVEKQRARALTMQTRVGVQDSRVANALTSIEDAHALALNRLFLPDAAAIWNRASPSAGENGISNEILRSLARQWEGLGTYVDQQAARFVLAIVIFVSLSALLYWARRRICALPSEPTGLSSASRVCEMPFAAALILTLLGSRWIFPQAPRVLWAMLGALALFPSVMILRGLMRTELRPLLYALLALFFVDQLRSVTAAIEFLPRFLFLAEMLGAVLTALWLIRSAGRSPRTSPDDPRARTILKIAGYISLFIASAAFAANIFGYVVLATLLGNALLQSSYLALILYTAIEVLDGLVMVALSTRPFAALGTVSRHRLLLRRRIRRVLQVTAMFVWVLALLQRLLLRDRFFTAFRKFLSAEIAFGSITLSPGDVLAFAATVWAAFLVSRFVRFLLDEDVYPRVGLKRGVPYAISNTLHYLILVGGFFLAVAALGFDMTRVTILAGAFSVGVGFGLQNIFNNFVSGLILLFERPINIGDVVQIDDASGVVERIGVRASIIRTANGSEIIMPNGKLISERLINWTLSSRQHGIELPVAVAQGTDPGRVIQLLEKTAAAHPLVTGDPPPQALVVKLGQDSLAFELRAWTEQSEQWMQIRSDLAIAISSTLAAEKIPIR